MTERNRVASLWGGAVCIGVAAWLPFVLPGYLVLQGALVLVYAMAILGLNLLLGFSGQVCLAQGAFLACGAYTSGMLCVHAGVAPLATLPAAALVTAAVGIVVGLPALRLGGLQLAIVTFGIALLVPQLILKFDRYTKGVTGLSFDPPVPPALLAERPETWLYLLCLAAALLCVSVMLQLLRGDTGRALRALRDNPLIAESLGVNLTRARLTAFAVSAAFAGLAGGLYAVVNAYISPQSFVAGKSIEILIGAIVGGITSVGGAFLGAAFIVFVPEWTAEWNPALGGLIYGACLIVVMLLARTGLIGVPKTLLQRVRRCRPRFKRHSMRRAPNTTVHTTASIPPLRQGDTA